MAGRWNAETDPIVSASGTDRSSACLSNGKNANLVAEILEAVGEPSYLLNDQIDSFGTADGDAGGVGRQHLLASGLDGLAGLSQFGDRARRPSRVRPRVCPPLTLSLRMKGLLS